MSALVEIPKGRRSKFEIDKKTGLIRLDRYLYSSSHYPGDYGFVPQTLAEDGDALDILVMVNEPTFSGCLIKARVIGLFRTKDRRVNDLGATGTQFDQLVINGLATFGGSLNVVMINGFVPVSGSAFEIVKYLGGS